MDRRGEGVNIAHDDGIDCSKDEVFTQQSGAQECDINYIMDRALKGADVSSLRNPRSPQYGDFTQIPTDLRECLEVVRKADQAFMSLDAHVRKRFDNDPAKLMDFLHDPANRDEAVTLGLIQGTPVIKVDEREEKIRDLEAQVAALSGTKKAKSKKVDDDE